MEPNNNNITSIQEKVLGKIRSEEITMRPKVFFTLKMIALGAVAVAILLISISICSYILFSIRESSDTNLIRFGPPGWLIFLQLFPWWLLLADIALIVFLEWLLRKFRFSYRMPFLYLLAGLLGVTILASIVTDQTHLNDNLLQDARDNRIPFAQGFYDAGRHPPPPGSGACPCIVKKINNDGSVLMQENDPDGTIKEVTVILPPHTSTSSIMVGQQLFVVGQYIHGVLHAMGLQPVQH